MKPITRTKQDGKLLQDILAAIVFENAGLLESQFAYIWTSDWIPLKKRIEQEIERLKMEKQPHES